MSVRYHLRYATCADALDIHNIMRRVSESMSNPENFVCDTLAFVQRHISEEGCCVVAYVDGGRLVASLIVRFPEMCEDNLGNEIGLSREQLMQTAHMESAVVLPECRGDGLQQKMIAYVELGLLEQGYKHLFATVAPENMPSLHTLEKCGYQIIKTTEKYGGLRRHILYKQV